MSGNIANWRNQDDAAYMHMKIDPATNQRTESMISEMQQAVLTPSVSPCKTLVFSLVSFVAGIAAMKAYTHYTKK